MKHSHLGLLALGLLLSSLGANAQATVASWALLGQPGNQTSTTGSTTGAGSAYVTAADMVRGAGLAPGAATNSMSSTGWAGTDSEDYFQFGLTVAAGYSLDLGEFRIGTRSSGTGPGTIGVYTSTDGYATTVATITQGDGNYVNSIIDLSGLGSITGDFSLRLFEIGDLRANGSGLATASTGTFRITNYFNSGVDSGSTSFSGTVAAIPEPSTYAMILGGLTLGLVALRRRRA